MVFNGCLGGRCWELVGGNLKDFNFVEILLWKEVREPHLVSDYQRWKFWLCLLQNLRHLKSFIFFRIFFNLSGFKFLRLVLLIGSVDAQSTGVVVRSLSWDGFLNALRKQAFQLDIEVHGKAWLEKLNLEEILFDGSAETLVHPAAVLMSEPFTYSGKKYWVSRHYNWGVKKALAQLPKVLCNGVSLIYKETRGRTGPDTVAPQLLVFHCVAEDVLV